MAGRVKFEPASGGACWRVRHEGGDVEGHMPFKNRFVVEGEEAEGHMPRIRSGFSLEPDGEDDNGEQLYRIEGDDAEAHMPRLKSGFTLEPTGEEEGGDPVYRVLSDEDDAEGHLARSGR
jgi:hypothetical protein